MPEKMTHEALDLIRRDAALPREHQTPGADERERLLAHITALESERDEAKRMHAANVEAGGALSVEFDRAGVGNPADGVFTRARSLLAERATLHERVQALEGERTIGLACLGDAANTQFRTVEQAADYLKRAVVERDSLASTVEAEKAPSTAEAFELLRSDIELIGKVYGFGVDRHDGRIMSTISLLEGRMGRQDAAIRQAVNALDGLLGDSDLPDDIRPGVLAMQALRAALADAPAVQPELAALIEGFDAEVQAAEDHAARPTGGQQVTPCGDFVRCTPSLLGRLRWWANALKQGRTGVPVFTAEEVEREHRIALDDTTYLMERLAALRK